MRRPTIWNWLKVMQACSQIYSFWDSRWDLSFSITDSGDIQKHVTYCRVLPRENALKLLGTPEGIQRSCDSARKILVRRLIPRPSPPPYHYAARVREIKNYMHSVFILLRNALRELVSSIQTSLRIMRYTTAVEHAVVNAWIAKHCWQSPHKSCVHKLIYCCFHMHAGIP